MQRGCTTWQPGSCRPRGVAQLPHEAPGPITLPRGTLEQLIKHRGNTAQRLRDNGGRRRSEQPPPPPQLQERTPSPAERQCSPHPPFPQHLRCTGP